MLGLCMLQHWSRHRETEITFFQILKNLKKLKADQSEEIRHARVSRFSDLRQQSVQHWSSRRGADWFSRKREANRSNEIRLYDRHHVSGFGIFEASVTHSSPHGRMG